MLTCSVSLSLMLLAYSLLIVSQRFAAATPLTLVVPSVAPLPPPPPLTKMSQQPLIRAI